jgi:hypothetical protein
MKPDLNPLKNWASKSDTSKLATVAVVVYVLLAVVALMLAASSAAKSEPVADPAVTQETLSATVCVPGYTKSIRHRARHLSRLKLALMAEAGLSPEVKAEFRLDHVLPLTLGGNPRDLTNLALQPLALSYRKDRIERKLGCLVCTGQISLQEAQSAILDDWQAAYHKYALIKCRRPRSAPTPHEAASTPQ